jgi:ribonuclease Z
MLDVCLLGTGGMMPLPNRFLTSLMCRLNGKMMMIDCGEATQISIALLGWGFKSIDVICFTHFHADHISGLPGLLLAMSNSGREEDLTLIGPPGLNHVLNGLRVIAPRLPYNINCIELTADKLSEIRQNGGALLVSGFQISVESVKHQIPCFAYRLDVKRKGKFDPERAKALGIPLRAWSPLQKTGYALFDGVEYFGDMVMGDERKGLSIAYCTDSRPTSGLPKFINGVDLFICEGLYGDNDKKEKAIEHGHMIYSEAAEIAKAGNVKELWLTHFSPAMTNPKEFLWTAKEIFKNSFAGYDRRCKTLVFEDDDE